MLYPEIDPVIFQMGPIGIHWYGVTYLVGFIGAFWLCYRSRAKQVLAWTADDILDLFFYAALGIIFGGTWGYLFFYEPGLLIQDPMRLLQFWEPGRSFHGGLLGVLVAVVWFSRAHQRSFLAVCDFIAPVVPIGLAMGRLGNFINGELWGRITQSNWGMVFPKAGSLPRHPSQLYECALEGIVLLCILQWYARKPRLTGSISALFLLLYGIFRFLVEFLREPDFSHGFIALGWATMGQALSLPMIVIGLYIYKYAQNPSNKRGY